MSAEAIYNMLHDMKYGKERREGEEARRGGEERS